MRRPSRMSWVVSLGLVLASALVTSTSTSTSRPPSTLAPTQQSDPSPRTTSFRSGVNLVLLMVAAVDQDERFVTDLVTDDFAVFEDGERQELEFFSAGDVPLDLAVLLDTSSSMQDKLSLVQAAATGFVRTLGPNDRGAVVEFNDRASFLSGFTSSLDELETAIRSTEATGGTALYNALYVTLDSFARLPSDRDEIRRQAIVVLSDGDDTTSLVGVGDVLEQARNARVRIYTVSLVDQSAARTTRQYGGHNYTSGADQTMTTLARDSGARSFFPSKISDLASVYSLIAEELSNLYVVGYASTHAGDSTYRSIRVQIVTRPNVFARTRTGYVAPEAEAASRRR